MFLSSVQEKFFSEYEARIFLCSNRSRGTSTVLLAQTMVLEWEGGCTRCLFARERGEVPLWFDGDLRKKVFTLFSSKTRLLLSFGIVI